VTFSARTLQVMESEPHAAVELQRTTSAGNRFPLGCSHASDQPPLALILKRLHK
jgi:hypothetical protein